MQRRRGVAEDVVGVRVTGLAHGDADTGGEQDLAIAAWEWSEQRSQEPLGGDHRVPEILQAAQQDAEPVALEPRDQIVVAHAARALGAADGGFQAPCRCGQQRIGDERGRGRGAVERAAEIDQQDREVKSVVAGRPADGTGDMLDEQQVVR